MIIEEIQLISKTIATTIVSEGPRRQSIDSWKADRGERRVTAWRVEFTDAIEGTK